MFHFAGICTVSSWPGHCGVPMAAPLHSYRLRHGFSSPYFHYFSGSQLDCEYIELELLVKA